MSVGLGRSILRSASDQLRSSLPLASVRPLGGFVRSFWTTTGPLSRSHLSLWGSLNIDIRPPPLDWPFFIKLLSLSLVSWLKSWGNCPPCLDPFQVFSS